MNFKDAWSLTDEELAQVLDFADVVGGWMKAVRAEAFKRASQVDGCIPGYKLTAGQASYQFRTPEVAEGKLIELGLTRADLYEESFISPAQAKAKLKAKFKGRGHKEVWDKYDSLVKNVGGGGTSLVRDIDARDEVKRGHEFKDMIDKHAKTEVDDLL